MNESNCDKEMLQFTRNTVIGFNGSKPLVTMDLYNSLESKIHKDFVVSWGAFTLVIDAWHETHSENEETIFGNLKEYSKSYNIICHFKPHSLHFPPIIFFHFYFFAYGISSSSLNRQDIWTYYLIVELQAINS